MLRRSFSATRAAAVYSSIQWRPQQHPSFLTLALLIYESINRRCGPSAGLGGPDPCADHLTFLPEDEGVERNLRLPRQHVFHVCMQRTKYLVQKQRVRSRRRNHAGEPGGPFGGTITSLASSALCANSVQCNSCQASSNPEACHYVCPLTSQTFRPTAINTPSTHGPSLLSALTA